jgi:hypothetical protein
MEVKFLSHQYELLVHSLSISCSFSKYELIDDADV